MGTDQTDEEDTAPTAASRVGPPDEAEHLDRLLMSELSALNYLLGQYVLRYYDADAGRVEPVATDEEQALARSIAAAAESIRARAARREHEEGGRR